MTVVFENPANGYRVKVDSALAWLWTSIFGPFFFLFRGSTLHFFVWWLAAFTAIGPFLYPFFAASILRRMYYERGYRAVEQRPTSVATFAAVAAVFIVPILFIILIVSLGGSSSHDSQSSLTTRRPSSAPVAAVSATPAALGQPPRVVASAAPGATPEAPTVAMPETLYSTVGIARGDTLNVRSGPGADYPIVERLASGFTGLRIIGGPVMNDTTEWVQISFAGQSGWVARRYLTPQQLPSGKLVQNDDEAVLTLPTGETFVSKTVEDFDVLIFPNGQKFVSKTAKGGGQTHVPFVSTDGAVVAIVRHPATKTDTLHIYVKDSTGKFKEIENTNERVAKLLKGVKVNWPLNYDPPEKAAEEALNIVSMSGHTLTLDAVSYWGGHESKTYEFRITVASNGSLALAGPTGGEEQPSVARPTEPGQRHDNVSDEEEGHSIAERVNAFFKQVQVRDYSAVETKLRAEYLTKRFQEERTMQDNHPEETDGDPYTLSDGEWDIGAIEVKDIKVHDARAEASMTRAGIDHGMKVSVAKANGKWMIDKIYFEQRTRVDEPTATPASHPEARKRLDLETSLPDGPSSEALESLLRDYVADNPSYSPTQRSGVVEAYQNGLFVNEVRKGTMTNQYTRSIDGETFFIYDFDIEVGMKSTPLGTRLSTAPPGTLDEIFSQLVRKTSLSVGVVKRGKKWYIRAAPK